MTRKTALFLPTLLLFGLAACGSDDTVEPAASTPDKATVDKTQVADAGRDDGFVNIPATPSSPFIFEYRIIGTPIVGSPVSFDLNVRSLLGDDPIDISYQIVDTTALAMPDAQPQQVRVAPLAGESLVRERVTVIPMREGRMYFNVSAAVQTDEGTTSTVISIPLHVGEVDTGLVEHGELETNEEGETTRVLREN